jgi:hypothetical protein
MAETLTVTLQVKDEQAKKKLEDFSKSLEKTGEKAGESAKEAKKDWKGLGELFTGLLPRNIQGLLRSFKATQRGVKGVSKSFKALKAAWASIGIGLIILALEELVANWDAISEALGFVDKEAERNAELVAEQDRAVRDLNTSTRGYVQILGDATASEEARAEALSELNREFNGIIDLEADQATQLKQANEALAIKEKLERARIKQSQTLTTLREAEVAAEADYNTVVSEYKGFWESGRQAQERLQRESLEANEANKEATAELAQAQAEYNALVGEAKELVQERADAEREAERLRKEGEALAKKQAQMRMKILEDLAIYEQELGLQGEENAEALEIMRTKRRQKAAMEQAKEAKLSQEDMERLEAQHQQELTDIENKYQEERDEQAKSDLERLEQAEMTQGERQIKAVEDRYAELIALAEQYGRDTTALEAQRQAELDKIRGGGADKEIKELTAMYELERELQLLSMDDRTAKFEKERDDANAMAQDRMAIAQAGYEKEKEQLVAQGLDTSELENQHAMLMKQIRQQLADDLVTIDQAEAQSFVDSRREMIESALDFADTVGGVLQEMQAVRDAVTESAIIEAKIRGASDEEIARIEAEAAERERRFAVGQVLLAQGQSIANAILGATQAAAATGPGAPFAIAGFIATAVGSVVAGWAQIKKIMNEAQAVNIPTPDAGGGGGVQRAMTQALDPNLATDFSNEYTGEGGAPEPIKSYVVLSDIEGQQRDYDTISSNASL